MKFIKWSFLHHSKPDQKRSIAERGPLRKEVRVKWEEAQWKPETLSSRGEWRKREKEREVEGGPKSKKKKKKNEREKKIKIKIKITRNNGSRRNTMMRTEPWHSREEHGEERKKEKRDGIGFWESMARSPPSQNWKKRQRRKLKNTLQKENKTKISSAAILPWRGEIGSKEERGLQKKKEIREGDRGSD